MMDAFAAAFPGEVPPDTLNLNPAALVQDQPHPTCHNLEQAQLQQQQPHRHADPNRRQLHHATRSHSSIDTSLLSTIS